MRTRNLVPVVAGLVVLAAAASAPDRSPAPLPTARNSSSAPTPPGPGALDLITVDTRGIVSTGVAGSADFVPIPGDDTVTPRRTVRLDVGVADNDPDTAAAVAVAVLPMGDDGTGRVGGAPNATRLLRVTVVDTSTGRILIGGSAASRSRGVPVAGASAMLDRLEPRGADPLADGADWTPGAAGEPADLAVEVYCPDTPELRALAGAESDLSLMLFGAPSP
ncbi:hypothetical protein ACU4GD_45410 [Cupriavidus basilensis]